MATYRCSACNMGSFPTLASAATPFAGKFVVTIQAVGAWDVTCFCDPKENQPGEMPITNWSKNNETQSAGNIRFAPFANNEAFFKKHASKMLVINGVDSQTNAHGIGETVNWSGRTAAGYPTLTALYSAINAPWCTCRPCRCIQGSSYRHYSLLKKQLKPRLVV